MLAVIAAEHNSQALSRGCCCLPLHLTVVLPLLLLLLLQLLLSSPATYSQAAIQASVKDDTLVLQAQVLENPTSGNTSREQQVRLAVFQHTQGNRNDPTPTNCVVCWGLLGAPDTGRLLVAVLQGVDYLAAQKIEELIINTTTVQLKSGADVVTLDKNRDACVLGPRTYVTAQPKDKMVFQVCS